MGFSRFYLGRHTLDQILLGGTLGALSVHFFHYCLKPQMFDPTFKPSAGSTPLTSAQYWNKFFTATAVFGVLITQVVLIYIYVDNYVEIPEAWVENMNKFCKNIRLTETFHHNSVAV